MSLVAQISARPREVFKDFDLSFRVNPATGDLLTKNTEESVKQAIKVLILTNFYERPFEPLLGSSVTGALFENYTAELEIFLKREIGRVVTTYEGRVSLRDVRVGYDEQDTIRVKVEFSILGLAKPANLDMIFERVR